MLEIDTRAIHKKDDKISGKTGENDKSKLWVDIGKPTGPHSAWDDPTLDTG